MSLAKNLEMRFPRSCSPPSYDKNSDDIIVSRGYLVPGTGRGILPIHHRLVFLEVHYNTVSVRSALIVLL